MDYQGLTINHFEHDTFQLKYQDLNMCLDPFNLTAGQIEPADVILITHDHFDHCSKNDIEKISTPNTIIVAPFKCEAELKNIKVKEINYLEPSQLLSFKNINVEAVPAYNINKFRSGNTPYHPKESNYLGYVITFNNQIKVYLAGDTDKIPEMANLKEIDVALLPVSGTYVMDWQEAVEAAKIIKPQIAIPMHYGSIIGTKADAENFQKKLVGICDVPII